MMFGVGTLFGVVMGGVMYAPSELANQPPPWELWARGTIMPTAAAATHVAGAGPARHLAPAPAPGAPAAVAAPEPVVAAPETLAVAAAPAVAAPAPAAAASAPAPAPHAATSPLLVANRSPAPARRKVHIEESLAETPATAAPAREAIRVAPEPLPAAAEAAAPARSDGQAFTDPSR